MSTAGPSQIIADLAALIAELHDVTTNVGDGLLELVESARQNVSGAQYTGITQIDRNHRVSTVVATHRYPRDLDDIQNRHQQGPCVTAAWDHHTVIVDDVATDRRWPRFAADVVMTTPVRSILSFEVGGSGEAVTALNFHAEHPGAFGEEARELGLIFATNTALAWTVMRKKDEFRSALASRDVVGQAKGIIMERYRVSAIQAFELLERLSRNSHSKLADTAAALISSENLN